MDPKFGHASPQPHQSEVRGSSSVILPLPTEVIAQIKSSVTITSLTFAILGLVQNSLDAQAKKINIDVDFRRGGCIVEDDGLGILPTEFDENGGLGKLYRRTMAVVFVSNRLTVNRHLKVQNLFNKLWMQWNLSLLLSFTLLVECHIALSPAPINQQRDFSPFQTHFKKCARTGISKS
jgi:hypothetical protein